jgi:hypothetical protein
MRIRKVPVTPEQFKARTERLAEEIMDLVGNSCELKSVLTALEIIRRSIRSNIEHSMLTEPEGTLERFDAEMAEHFGRLHFNGPEEPS